MNLWMIGQDDSVFYQDAGGNTLSRLSRYLEEIQKVEPASTLTDFIYTRRGCQPVSPRRGLYLVPVRAPRLQTFPLAIGPAARRIVAERPPDVLTVQTPFEAGLAARMANMGIGGRAPLEAQVHFQIFSPYWLDEHLTWNRLRLVLARQVLSGASSVRAVSSPIQAGLIGNFRLPAGRITRLPVPVFYETPASAGELDAEREPAVLFAGRLSYQKNIPGLFQVIEQVTDRRPGVRFWIAGDGPLRGEVQRRLEKLGEHRATWLGRVPYEKLRSYYQRAQVVILPSLYEGFGRVLVEAYRLGTPCVATRSGGPEDIIRDGETGFLTPVEDIALFSEKVLWLLEHSQEAHQMGRAGRDWVLEAFDPDRLVQLIAQQWFVLARLAGEG